MTRVLVSAFVFALLIFGGLAGSAAAQDTLNCDDFPNRDAAQAELNANPDDPNGLDGRPGPGNGDGQACENHNYGSGSGSGGGNAGSDDTATDDTPAEEPVAGEVVPEDTASDDTGDAAAADDTEELPDTGTGPVTASSSSAALMMLVGAALFAVAGGTVRSRVTH